ncbi:MULTISPECIES: COG3014 family protein [unclassified Carboxylicivirga]|uniref:COG3014 family protein n=1 Tax=Carboxylicivirga TaxID=1628153 RepID=UPI003D33E656
MKPKSLIFIILTILLIGCATYYENNIKLQSLIAAGQFESADKILAKDTKGASGKNRYLYFCNRGVVSFMNGQYELSNQYFNQADYYVEDFRKSMGSEALALITNPMVKPYRPEDFEAVLVHFYKALNFIYLNNYEGALVECRRVNIVLQKLNEKYKKNKNKYTRDAFAHCLMGLIYEAAGNTNDAFIAYRNALEIYEEDYQPMFGVSTPLQLQNDLMRTAHQLGFGTELDFYENKFGRQYQAEDPDKGHLVFFWLNGFGPVKDEWSINFTNTGYNDGWITLANEEYGLNFPIYIGNKSSSDQAAFKNLSFLRVAFPKYRERKPLFNQASLANDGQDYPLEMAQDINAIAFQCLKDRMLREMAAGIARLATKKAMEELARSENDNLGTIISIVNAMTEKADTRNWQSLPHSISYCRVTLDEGTHSVQLNTRGRAQHSVPFTFQIKKNQTTFFAFHNLESEGI